MTEAQLQQGWDHTLDAYLPQLGGGGDCAQSGGSAQSGEGGAMFASQHDNSEIHIGYGAPWENFQIVLFFYTNRFSLAIYPNSGVKKKRSHHHHPPPHESPPSADPEPALEPPLDTCSLTMIPPM